MAKQSRNDLELANLMSMSQEEFNEQSRITGVPIHNIPFEMKLVDIDDFTAISGWQPRDRTDANVLLQSILATGLSTPPKVNHTKDGIFQMLDAHHRIATLKLIRDEHPEDWVRLGFNEGINTQVYTALEADNVFNLRNDSSRFQQSLRDAIEVLHVLEQYYVKGMSDTQVRIAQWRLIVEVLCSTPTKMSLYSQWRTHTVDSKREMQNSIMTACRGHMQLLRDAWRVPDFVRSHWEQGVRGLPLKHDLEMNFIEFSDSSPLAYKLKAKDLATLVKAHEADVKQDKEDNDFLVSKQTPGKGVLMAYAKIMAKVDSDKLNPPDKPLSAQVIKTHQDETKSKVGKTLFNAVLGNQNAIANLPSLLDDVLQSEKAHKIDHDFMSQIEILIGGRKYALPTVDRNDILDIVRTAVDTLVVPEANVPEAKDVTANDTPSKKSVKRKLANKVSK